MMMNNIELNNMQMTARYMTDCRDYVNFYHTGCDVFQKATGQNLRTFLPHLDNHPCEIGTRNWLVRVSDSHGRFQIHDRAIILLLCSRAGYQTFLPIPSSQFCPADLLMLGCKLLMGSKDIATNNPQQTELLDEADHRVQEFWGALIDDFIYMLPAGIVFTGFGDQSPDFLMRVNYRAYDLMAAKAEWWTEKIPLLATSYLRFSDENAGVPAHYHAEVAKLGKLVNILKGYAARFGADGERERLEYAYYLLGIMKKGLAFPKGFANYGEVMSYLLPAKIDWFKLL